jgi:hypothetical protein
MRPLAFGVLISIGASSAQAQDTVFEVDHGLWRFTNTFAIPGMRVNNSDTVTRCLTPEQAQRSLNEITNEMTGGEDNNCRVSNVSDLPGKISLDIECTANSGGLQMQSTGRMVYEYDRTSYSGGATGEIIVQGRTMPYTGQGEATRLGKC